MIGATEPVQIGPTPSTIQASRRILRVAATVWSAVWLPAVVAALAVDWDAGSLSPWLSVCLLTVATAAWFACLILRWLPVEIFVVTVLGTGLVQVANTIPQAPEHVVGAMVPWIHVGLMCAGLLLRPRLAAAVVAVTAGLEWLLLLPQWLDRVDVIDAFRISSGSAVYSFAIGMAIVSCVAGSDRLARMDDQAASELDAAEETERSEDARGKAVAQVGRALHDTVVNTLGFIGRGGVGASFRDISQMRARCRFDLAAVRDLSVPRSQPVHETGGSGLLEWLGDAARERARALGLRLNDDVGGTDPLAGQELIVAASSVIDEGLLNVAKHSGTDEAWLDVASSRDSLRISLHDEGSGCGRTSAEGLALSLRERMAGTSASVSVVSSPSAGTRIDLVWAAGSAELNRSRRDLAGPIDEDRLARGVFGLIARRASIWISLTLLWFILLGLGVGSGASDAVAFGLMVSGISFALFAGRGGRQVPWRMAAVLTLLVAAIVYLPMVGSSGCARVGAWWWGPDGGMLVLVVLALLVDDWRWWLAAGFVYFGAVAAVLLPVASDAGECVQLASAVLIGNAAVLAGVVAFRQMLARTGREAAGRRAMARQARSRVVAARVSRQVKEDASGAALRSVGPILSGLADGSMSPADPTVRRRCLAEESALRATLAIGATGTGIGRMAVGWARLAADLGIRLEVRPIETDAGAPPDALAWVSSVVASVLSRMEPGQQATLTTLPDGRAVILALHCPRLSDADRSWLDSPPAGVVASAEDIGGECLIEMTLSPDG